MTRAAERPKRPQIRHAAPTAATRSCSESPAMGHLSRHASKLAPYSIGPSPLRNGPRRVLNLPGAPVDRVRTPTGVHRDLKSDRWLRYSRKLLATNLAALDAQASFTTSIANGALWFHAV